MSMRWTRNWMSEAGFEKDDSKYVRVIADKDIESTIGKELPVVMKQCSGSTKKKKKKQK